MPNNKTSWLKPDRRLTGIIVGLCFIAVFGAIGIRLLTGTHAQTPQSAATCTINSNYVNSCRPWLGGVAMGNPGTPSAPINSKDYVTQYTNLVQLAGHNLDTFREYHNCNGSTCAVGGLPLDPSNPLGAAEIHFADQGVAIDVNWTPDSDWADASGSDASVNAAIEQVADNIKAVAPHKIFLTVVVEPESKVTGACASGGGSSGSPQDYKNMWQNVENIFNGQGLTNVIWTMDYMSYKGNECEVTQLWPGSNLVDWVFYDTYDHDNKLGTTFANTAGQFYDYLTGLASSSDPTTAAIGKEINSKPWGLGEFGTCQNTDPSNADQYFADMATAIKDNTYPNLKLYQVFATDSNDAGYGCFTDYDSDPSSPAANSGAYDATKQQYFNRIVAAVYGTGGGSTSPSPTVSFTSPSAGSTVSGSSVSVAAKASVGKGATISGITLKAGGNVLQTCTSSTCSVAWDTSKLTNGTYTLEADTTASDGKSGSSTENVTVKNAQAVTISAPTGLQSPSQTTTSANLTWNASVDSKYPASQLTYQLLRNGTVIKTTGKGATSAADSGLKPGTYYDYSVVGHDPAGNASGTSNVLPVKTTAPDCVKPAAPQGLSGKAGGPTSVTLSWKAVPDPSASCVITGYVVSRDSVPLSQPGTTSYTDDTATADTTYSYQVVAVETGNIAGADSSVKVTTPVSTKPDPGPSAPGDVNAIALSASQVNLTWNASSDPVTGIKDYEILRDGKQIGTTASPSFGDSSLSADTAYRYQVVAVSGGGKTAGSATVTVTTLGPSSTGTGPGNGDAGGGNEIPPILDDTTSVGSGSDTGSSVSQNPTELGSSTADQFSSGGTNGGNGSVHQRLNAKRVAYLSTGGGVIVLLIAGGAWWWFRKRRIAYQPVRDPDLTPRVVVGGNDNDDGPMAPQGPGTGSP